MYELIKEFAIEIIAAFSVLLLVFVYRLAAGRVVIGIARILLPGLRRVGLLNLHQSSKSAKKRILAAIERTRDVKLLSNRGSEWVGEDTAMLSRVISKRAQHLKVRVVLLHKTARWISMWSASRGESAEVTTTNLDVAHRTVEHFFKKNPALAHKSGVRYHRDDPVWRAVMTDDRLFISSYANIGQARDAIVLEFDGPDTEIYQAVKRYFNFMWHRRAESQEGVVEDDSSSAGEYSFEMSSGAVVFCAHAGVTRLLMVERQDGQLTLPKGHVKPDERIETAALREVCEETGLKPDAIEFLKNLGWYRNPLKIGGGRKIYKIVYYFLARVVPVGGSLPALVADSDHKSVGWYTLSDISGRRLAYSHVRNVIEKAVAELQVEAQQIRLPEGADA